MSSTASGLDRLADFCALSPAKQAGAHVRLATIEAAEAFAAAGPRKAKLEEYCAANGIAIRTLYRWMGRLRDKGVAGLADDYGNRAGTGVIESSEEVQQYLLGVLFEKPHIRALRAVELIQSVRPDLAEGLTESVVQRWLGKWKHQNAQLFTYVSNPDAWKNKFKAAFGTADENILRLNQLWELDSTPADLLLVDGRHSVLGCIDVYTRRMKLLVSKTSKAVSVSALVRRALLDWGVPESIRTDQGQDYTSKHLRAVLRSLEIAHKICQPFASEQKPFIERSFRTFSHDLVELLPGYIGHSVADAQRIRAGATFAERLGERDAAIKVELTSTELQSFCDRWTSTRYEHAPHSGLDGQTPFSRTTSWTGPVRRIDAADERALDVLLAEAPEGGTRAVSKKGISVGNARYDAPELGPLIGQRVQVRRDATSLGQVLVYDGDGKFVCVAIAPELQGVTRQEAAKAVKDAQVTAMRKGRDLMKEAGKEVRRSLANGSMVETIIENRAEQVAPVLAFQRRPEEYSTPALAEAGKAAEAVDALPAPVAMLSTKRATKDAEDDGRAWKDAQWAQFKALQARTDLSEDDAGWCRWFEGTALYRSRKFVEGADMSPAIRR
jgi:putative transposase